MSEEIRDGFTRVTTPLSVFNDFSMITPAVLQNACLRGTMVHNYCSLYAEGEYFPEPSEALGGYISSYTNWFDRMVDEVLLVEQRFYNDPLRLTGAIDLVAVVSGDKSPSIIDIKTCSVKSSTWNLQLSAYKWLYNSDLNMGIKAERRIVVQLNKEGKPPKIHEYTNHEKDLDLYFSALRLWRYFNV